MLGRSGRARLSMHGLARDTAILLAERVVRLLAGLLVAIYCARTLGPSAYGLYSYALSLVLLFSFLGQAGLEQILVRELVHKGAAAEATLAAAFSLRLIGASGAGIVAILAARLGASADLPVTLLVSLLALSGLLQASYVADAWLQAQRAFRPSSTAKTIALLVAALGRIVAASSAAPLLGLALVSVGEAVLTGVLLGWVARDKGLRLRHALAALDRREQRRLWTAARPMLLSSFAVALYARGDVFLLGRLSSLGEVGMYSAAASLSEALYVLPVALMTAAGPRLAELHRRDPPGFRAACMSLVSVSSGAGLAVALALSLLASPIVSLVYGSRFADAPSILAVHVWSTWMVFVSVASEPWYVNEGLQHLYVRKTVIAAVSNLALNLWLIPKHGGLGAAVATVVSYALSAFGCNVLWRETRGLFFLQLRAMSSMPSFPLRSGRA
ncbi:MAG: polysaccharide biosynthesis protein [Myxococcaceae bacterium]|nr:polysaccharide biosynthesis protein [Myxococcaceae bacterium]